MLAEIIESHETRSASTFLFFGFIAAPFRQYAYLLVELLYGAVVRIHAFLCRYDLTLQRSLHSIGRLPRFFLLLIQRGYLFYDLVDQHLHRARRWWFRRSGSLRA